MTDDAIEPPPDSLLTRLLDLESRIYVLEQALRRAFGERWLTEGEQAKDGE